MGWQCSPPGLSQSDRANSSGSIFFSGTPVLEPFQEKFQWCSMAINGYARVDPNQ
jgi:hypothetical protein